MDLIDRYLAAIRRCLPESFDHRDDVVAELGDELQSRIDEREAVLGRSLDERETAEVIKAFGHPRAVAARFESHQSLIGPELLPHYWYAVKMGLAIVLGLEVLGGVIGAFATGDAEFYWGSMSLAFNSVVYVFGIVTIMFVLVERVSPSPWPALLARWDPRHLPRVDDHFHVSRFGSGVEFFVSCGVLLVMFDFAGVQRLLTSVFLHPSTLAVQLTAGWAPVFVAIALSSAANALSSIVTYVRPELGRVRLAVQCASNLIGMAGIALTFRSAPLVNIAHGSPAGSAALELVARISLIATFGCLAFAAIWNVWKLVRKNRVANFSPAGV